MNMIFTQVRTGEESPTKGYNRFKYLYSLQGEVLNYGFDALSELEDYVFVVDEYSYSKNKLKLLHFINHFTKLVEENNVAANTRG